MEDSAVREPHKAESILSLGLSGRAGVPRRALGSRPPTSLGLPSAGTSKMLLPAGACIDGEQAVAPAGSWAKPLIAHPPHHPLPVLPSLSSLSSPARRQQPGTLGCILRWRAEFAGSPRGPQVTLQPGSGSEAGIVIHPRKKNNSNARRRALAGTQTPIPGIRCGPGYLVSASRGAASPQQPWAPSDRWEAKREPRSLASGQLFTHSPTQCAPRSQRWGKGTPGRLLRG